jgi:hypothetical protein
MLCFTIRHILSKDTKLSSAIDYLNFNSENQNKPLYPLIITDYRGSIISVRRCIFMFPFYYLLQVALSLQFLDNACLGLDLVHLPNL